MAIQYPAYDPNFVYDPNSPGNVEDRKNDPDDGIDYDEIIMATEANFRAGRMLRFHTIEELNAWIHEISERVGERNRAHREAS